MNILKNIVPTVQIAYHGQFLLLRHSFHKLPAVEASKCNFNFISTFPHTNNLQQTTLKTQRQTYDLYRLECKYSIELNILFVQSNRHSYKLELLNKCICALPSQQLLQLVIRGAEQQGCMKFVPAVCQKVNDIVVRDFRTCRYRMGLMCPFKDEQYRG